MLNFRPARPYLLLELVHQLVDISRVPLDHLPQPAIDLPLRVDYLQMAVPDFFQLRSIPECLLDDGLALG